MLFGAWLLNNWFDLLQSVGIIASLLFTASSLRSEMQTRRVANLFSITENHRSIWTEIHKRPALERVLNPQVEIRALEITQEEELFVNFVIFHMNAVFYARKVGLLFELEGLRQDIGYFLSLPIPNAIWKKSKVLQNEEFVSFVEDCLARNT